jgi:hypothetical protein
MKTSHITRVGLAALLSLSLSATTWAGPIAESAAKAATAAAAAQPGRSTTGSVLTWVGTSLFVGGLAVGLYSFINNKNGEFTEFGEAEASNNSAGIAGLAAAAAGGALIILGSKKGGASASMRLGANGVTVSRSVTW